MHIPRPAAVIFDWDDTIVSTWRIIYAALNETLAEMGRTPWTEAEARQKLGPPARVLFSGLFGEDKWQEADAIYISAYERAIAENIEVHAHAEDILRAFKAQAVPAVLLSTKRGPLLRREVGQLGFGHYFAAVVGAGDAPADKPDPAAAAFALRATGVPPGQDVWFIGDGFTDMACAHGAGCTPLLIETKPMEPQKLQATPPAARFPGHDALLDFVRQNLFAPARQEGA